MPSLMGVITAPCPYNICIYKSIQNLHRQFCIISYVTFTSFPVATLRILIFASGPATHSRGSFVPESILQVNENDVAALIEKSAQASSLQDMIVITSSSATNQHNRSKIPRPPLFILYITVYILVSQRK